MHAAKALVGGVTMAATEVLMYFLGLWSVVEAMPADTRSALELLIQSGLVALAVYYIPNSEAHPPPPVATPRGEPWT
jgi:hypothetical protein